jgi:hypothetical protein
MRDEAFTVSGVAAIVGAGVLASIESVAVEIAYGTLVAIAWVWAISQVRFTWAIEGPPRSRVSWRWKVSAWLSAKAAFFTIAGSFFWFDWFDPHLHAIAILVLAAVHVWSYAAWRRLPMPVPGQGARR